MATQEQKKIVNACDCCGGQEHHEPHEHHDYHNHSAGQASCDCCGDHAHHEHNHNHDHNHDHIHHAHAAHHAHNHEHSHDHSACGGTCTCATAAPQQHIHAARAPSTGASYTLFTLENLGCAHCAAKMEDKIRALPTVADASITFATKQLRVTAADALALLPKMQAICTQIEPEVKIVPPAAASSAASQPVQQGADRQLLLIAVGAVLFVVGLLLSDHSPFAALSNAGVSRGVFGVAYLLLGWKILLTAGKNLLRGQMLDENFLMSLATVGALLLGEYSEAVGVMLFYCIGEYCEERAVNLSRKQITEAVDLRPQVITVLDACGTPHECPASEGQVGQTIQVLVGERIPLDGVIVSGETRLDTAAITGESVPVSAGVGDAIHSGCINLSGVLTMRVTHVLEESMVSRILRAVEDAAASKPKIERVLTRFAHIYTPTVVAIAVLTALIPSVVTGDWNTWVHTALTFLVISCPCALVLSVPLAFFSGIGAGSKRGILFKSGASLEALHDIKCVAMDKTGTLTMGNFVVQAVTPQAGYAQAQLLAVAASCEARSTHPIAVSIVAAAREQGLALTAQTALQEKAGMGLVAQLNQQTIACGNAKLMADQGVAMPAQVDGTGSVVHVAIDGVYAGNIHVADTIKAEAASTIAALKKRGLTTAMMTGDHIKTAQRTAAEIGLDDVRGNLLPTDKVAGLQQLRAQHGAILYIGDGINDAPVLAGADVGGAMGSGADAAIEVADIVFMTSDLSTVDQALDIAHRTHAIVRTNIFMALSIKILVMILGITGIYSSMWLAIFADVGVALICVLNAIRTLYKK